MAHPEEDQIVVAISSVLPASRIRELARDLGVVMRQRKIDVVCLVQALHRHVGAEISRFHGTMNVA